MTSLVELIRRVENEALEIRNYVLQMKELEEIISDLLNTIVY